MPTVGCAGARVGLDDDHVGAILPACGGQGGLQFGAAAYLDGQGTEAARVLCKMHAPAATGPADQVVEARVARRGLQPLDASETPVIEQHDDELLVHSDGGLYFRAQHEI